MPRPIAPAPITPMISSRSLATLSTLEPRLSLLDKGTNALRVVLRPPRFPLQLRLERELGVEVVVHAGVEAALDQPERAGRHRREALGDVEARAREHGGRDDV